MKLSVAWIALFCSIVLGAADRCGADDSNARKVLFFDLWKLDSWDNLALRLGKPEWVPECNYRDPSAERGDVYSPSVWYDSSAKQWRMVYSTRWSPLTLMIASSEDGVTWKPLAVEGAGEDKLASNHLLTVPSGSGGAVYHDPERTDGYAFRLFGRQSGGPVVQRALTDPNHRWHELAKAEGDRPYIDEGIQVVSKDGLHWELKTGGHWDWHDHDWHPEPPVFAYWNGQTQQHVMVARPGWGDRRQCLRTSSDLKSWSEPRLELQPDSQDTEGTIGMYGMPVHPVGNGAGYVGLLWIFHNSSSEPVRSFNRFFGTMDAQLVYSYDGRRFFRSLRESFLELNAFPKHGCTQIRPCSIVETDEGISIYSQAQRAAHGRERAEQRPTDQPLATVMLHRLRKDGWTYLTSKGDWASLQTKPFVLRQPGIRINAAAPYGELQFQLTDEKSRPIEGFSFDDCVALRTEDSLAYPLRWRNGADWQEVLDRPLRLSIRLRQANLYSLEMAHHFLDAHDMWLLNEGKELPARPRFDF